MEEKVDSIEVSNFRKIIVNKDGKYILINVNDRNLLIDLYNTTKYFYETLSRLDVETQSPEDISKVCDEQTEIIDRLLGEGTTFNIFSTKNPTVAALVEFYLQFMQLMNKYLNEHQVKLENHVIQKFGKKYFSKTTRKTR